MSLFGEKELEALRQNADSCEIKNALAKWIATVEKSQQFEKKI